MPYRKQILIAYYVFNIIHFMKKLWVKRASTHETLLFKMFSVWIFPWPGYLGLKALNEHNTFPKKQYGSIFIPGSIEEKFEPTIDSRI